MNITMSIMNMNCHPHLVPSGRPIPVVSHITPIDKAAAAHARVRVDRTQKLPPVAAGPILPASPPPPPARPSVRPPRPSTTVGQTRPRRNPPWRSSR